MPRDPGAVGRACDDLRRVVSSEHAPRADDRDLSVPTGETNIWFESKAWRFERISERELSFFAFDCWEMELDDCFSKTRARTSPKLSPTIQKLSIRFQFRDLMIYMSPSAVDRPPQSVPGIRRDEGLHTELPGLSSQPLARCGISDCWCAFLLRESRVAKTKYALRLRRRSTVDHNATSAEPQLGIHQTHKTSRSIHLVSTLVLSQSCNFAYITRPARPHAPQS